MLNRQTFLPILLGIVIGIASFYPFTYTNPISMSLIGGIKRNQWMTHFDPSMKSQNLWLRNYVAFVGLLGSVRPEIIYLESIRDDENEKFIGDHDYILKGNSPNCRYWSFVIYDIENRRIEPFEETVVSSYRIPIQDDGTYEIILTAHPESYPGKQIINHSGKKFTLTMRIYGPDLGYYKDKESIPVASIKKVRPHG
ncbi:MAG: DUF1214 domain-containing protein [Candidatus Marinimicrobia bacterium]|nr:DUF1214 domain-containing protein [Candidatus Neomarinimicrobiota bacterium]MBL7009703.1 DUF1214 domain-containing protein [Candidatus Neomarinimicrobiota bacterium]MBL7029554.1 DUF1214 domain-containing protein [Candidatus Neomarinimicrobiota bacterium]